jgi:hypothetical protein
MTVAALSRIKIYDANGVTKAFPIPFQFLAASSVEVVLRDAAGGETIAQPTIAGGSGAVGTATFAVAPPTGMRVVIRGRQAIDQPMVYTTGDRFPAKSHERGLDRGAIIAQELDDKITDIGARAVRFPPGETFAQLPAAPMRADKILSFDALGRLLLSSASAMAQAIAPFLPAFLRGDPGGNVMSVGPFSSIAGLTILTGTDVIQTSGPTRGRLVADTTLTDAAAAPFPRTMAKTKNGRYFRRDEAFVDLREVGVNGSPGITGDTGAIKEALAYLDRFANAYGGVYRGTPRLKLAPYMRLDTTLSLKQSVIIEGDGNGYEGGRPSIIDCSNNPGTGIIVERADTLNGVMVPATTGADGAILRNFMLLGGRTGASQDAAAGLSIKTRTGVSDVVIEGFPGAGLRVVAAATEVGEKRGNANCSKFRDITIYSCFDGAYIEGADANAMKFDGMNVNYNARAGIFESSFLGNTHVGHHASANGLGVGGVAVMVSRNGRRYAPVLGQDAYWSTTAPGTLGPQGQLVWIYFEDGGPIPGTIPLWQSGGTYMFGGAYVSNNRNNRSTWLGLYVEGTQAPSQLMWPNSVWGGLLTNFGDAPSQNGEQGACMSNAAFQVGGQRLEPAGLLLSGPNVPDFRLKPHPSGYIRGDFGNGDSFHMVNFHGPWSPKGATLEAVQGFAAPNIPAFGTHADAAASPILRGTMYRVGRELGWKE